MDPHLSSRNRSSHTRALDADWQDVCALFQTYQEINPKKRFQALGKLFEGLCPWLERGIHATVSRHFLLLPTELLVARLFARAARRDALPHSWTLFLMWVESSILRDLASPEDAIGVVHGASGEPCAELQRRFNLLPHDQRALLYLYMVEGCSVEEVSSFTGIPCATVREGLRAVWSRIDEGDRTWEVPKGWRIPETGEQDGAAGS